MGIKGSFDDQGRLFSYFSWLTSLVLSWPLSLMYVPTSKSKVFFKELDPDHAQPLMLIYPCQAGLRGQRDCEKNRSKDYPAFSGMPFVSKAEPCCY